MPRAADVTRPDSATRELARSLLYEALYGRDVMLLHSHMTVHRTDTNTHQVWTPAAIGAALRLWSRCYGRRPTTQEWRHATQHGLPHATTVRQYWPTLAEAWKEALHGHQG